MRHILLCYKNEEIKLRVECYIREDVFIEQLKKGVIYYDTNLCNGSFEIINLNNFDRVVIENEQYYGKIVGSDNE